MKVRFYANIALKIATVLFTLMHAVPVRENAASTFIYRWSQGQKKLLVLLNKDVCGET